MFFIFWSLELKKKHSDPQFLNLISTYFPIKNNSRKFKEIASTIFYCIIPIYYLLLFIIPIYYHTYLLYHVYLLLFPSDENKIITWRSFFGWTYIEKFLRNRKGNCFTVNWSTWTTAYSASTYFMLVQVYSLDLKIERLSFNKYRFHIEPYRVNLKWWLFLE